MRRSTLVLAREDQLIGLVFLIFLITYSYHINQRRATFLTRVCAAANQLERILASSEPATQITTDNQIYDVP